jgi:hypothetical protein
MSVTVTVEPGAEPTKDDLESTKTIDEEHASENLTRANMAEYAVMKHLDGTLNPETQTDGDDGGYDVRLPDGDTIDVKSTHYEDGHLLIPNYTVGRLRADYYVLAIVPKGSRQVRLVGYATPDEILDKPTCDWNKAPCKAFKQKELNDLADLQRDGDAVDALVAEANSRLS